MKSKRNLRSIILLALLGIASLLFINIGFATDSAKVNVETANIREKAEAEGKILVQLSQNEEVQILEKNGEWYKVKTKNITGYIRSDLLDIKENQVEEKQEEVKDTKSEENVETEKEVKDNVEENKQTDLIEIGINYTKSDVKVKIVPTINASELGEIKKDEEVQVTEILNDWIYVETKNVRGWIRKDKVQKQQEKKDEVKQVEEVKEEPKQEEPKKTQVKKTMYVSKESINVRKEASTSSDVIKTLVLNTAVEVTEETNNGWSKVNINGAVGYISSALLSNKKQETSRSLETPRKTENQPETVQEQTAPKVENEVAAPAVNANGSSVVETAKGYIGSKYVYGGSSPSGFDCSGFTSYIYKQYGVSLNRTAAGQYSNGTAVSRENLQPGDLVMFGKSGINHVGIYIGGGQIVHAANSSRGVTIDTINSGYYYNNYVGARRVQ